MKIIFTFIWSFLLVTTLNYVVSSVGAVPFDFKLGAILSVVVALLILVITSILQNDQVVQEKH